MTNQERIVKASEELFFKYGIKSITMDDIAKHLGMSKKTIYLYYADKNEIIEVLMKQIMLHNEKQFKALSKNSENIILEVYSIMEHISRMFTKINPKMFYELQKFHPEVWKQFKDFKEECIASLVELAIKKGIKQGLVRKDINAKILTKLRMEQVDMGMNPEVFPPEQFKIVDVQLALLDHFLHGICTIKGHELINKYKKIKE